MNKKLNTFILLLIIQTFTFYFVYSIGIKLIPEASTNLLAILCLVSFGICVGSTQEGLWGDKS